MPRVSETERERERKRDREREREKGREKGESSEERNKDRACVTHSCIAFRPSFIYCYCLMLSYIRTCINAYKFMFTQCAPGFC